MRQPQNGQDPGSANVFRFNLTGLMVFCLCLIAGTSFLTGKLVASRQVPAPGPELNIPDPGEQDKYTFTRQGPWGELLTEDIRLERPVEYVSQKLRTVQAPVWTFHGMNVAQVKALFIANGLSQPETEKALAPDRVSTQVYLADDLVFTKNGQSYVRPWMIMRISDLRALYRDFTIGYLRKKTA